jgi:hypothetical protein
MPRPRKHSWAQAQRSAERPSLPRFQAYVWHVRRRWLQGHSGVDDHGVRLDHRLDLLQKCSVSGERHGEHYNFCGSCGGRIFKTGDLRFTKYLPQIARGFLGSGGISRSDDDGFASFCPAARQAQTLGAGTAKNRNGATHANSGSSAWWNVRPSAGCLRWMRE